MVQEHRAIRAVLELPEGFDPRRIVPDRGSPIDSLRAMLETILRETGATPLPQADAAKTHAKGVRAAPSTVASRSKLPPASIRRWK